MVSQGNASVEYTGNRSITHAPDSSGNSLIFGNDQECCRCWLPCPVKLIHIDENRCEDDIFDIYIINPDTLQSRFIAQVDLVSDPPGCCDPEGEEGTTCPQTRIEIEFEMTLADVGEDGTFILWATLVGTNCCNTFTRLIIEGPNGVIVTEYFIQDGYLQELNAFEICSLEESSIVAPP